MPTRAILMEIRRFHDLESLYEGFSTFAKSKNVEIIRKSNFTENSTLDDIRIDLDFNYQLIRIRVNDSTMKWLCAPIPAFSQVFYGNFDTEVSNKPLNETLEAFSHFSYEHYANEVVHTSWACK